MIIDKIREMAHKALGPGPRRRPRGLRIGIGDDAAVFRAEPGSDLLVTTDLLVEATHFEPHRHPPRALGHKLIARGLSDIAAMGGKPLYVLLSLCLPGWAGQQWQKQFFSGLFSLARKYSVCLIGGDLAAGGRFSADIVALGSVRRGRALERSKAEVGDVLYVSGRLGGAALGLQRLLAGRGPADAAVRRHLYPEPRIALGQCLLKLQVKAAMDLSDGLSIDLYRLARASRVGAEIWATSIPIFPGAALDQALHGGEDYELLFALNPRRKPPGHFEGIPLTAIGRITAGRRLLLVDAKGRKRPLPVKGYQHSL